MTSVSEIKPENRPLTEDEIKAWREVAFSHYNQRATLVGVVSLYCGLGVLPLSHLRSDWVRGDSDSLSIFVPAGPIDCDIGKEGGPCVTCTRARDGAYRMRRHAPRHVPVPDEKVREFLLNYFQLRDRTGITNKQVNSLFHELGEKAAIDITVSGRNLRYTYGTILARKGFALEEIRDAMGYLETDVNRGIKHARRFYDWIRDDAKDIYPCGELLADGTRCQRKRINPETKCHFHREDAEICGVETVDGTPCQLNSNCPVHTANKYECNAETRSGGSCSRTVSRRHLRCPQHQSTDNPGWEICGIELEDGSVCENAGNDDSGRCWRHDGRDVYRCGASIENGSCSVVVSSPDKRCRDHSDDGWTPDRCGYELDEGRSCRHIVSSPEAHCQYHR